jgi:DNA-binding response OmpR family regulator
LKGFLEWEERLTSETGEGVRLQRAIEQAVASVSNSKIKRAVGVVAEYPAHLPPVAGDERVIAGVLSDIIREVMLRTEREEVRVRVQLLPATGELPPVSLGRAKKLARAHGPMALISVSDADAPFASLKSGREGAPVEILPLPAALELEAMQEKFEPFEGRIWLENGLQASCCVWLAIPMRTVESEPEELGRLKRAVDTRLPEGVQAGQLILLCLENESMRTLLVDELAKQGYRVIPTGVSGEVLPLARANEPDLIILDLQSRSPTAIDVATLLKQDRRSARSPIMFLTTIEDPTGGVRMEVADFLLRREGTGAIVSTIDAVLKSGLHPTTRVMVIEPDAALRENIILHIQARGYPVLEASTPEESVALAERVPVGIALINAQLAEERDYWLLRQLRQTSRDLALYVIGKAITDEEGQAAINRGASGYGETAQLPELLDRVEERKEPPQESAPDR